MSYLHHSQINFIFHFFFNIYQCVSKDIKFSLLELNNCFRKCVLFPFLFTMLCTYHYNTCKLYYGYFINNIFKICYILFQNILLKMFHDERE